MAQIKVFYDRVGNTLTIWFGDPQGEYVCEETGDEVVLMKLDSGEFDFVEERGQKTRFLNP